MKSPITGKEMVLVKERRTMQFRKEDFTVVFHLYKCADSNEQFTTTGLDEVNIQQVYNQYRDKYNIPFPEEISRARAKYDIPAVKMSEILGLGANSYRQYEAGEMPSVSNAKLIHMAEDPEIFLEMVEMCTTIDQKVKNKYLYRVRQLIEEKKKNIFQKYVQTYVFGDHPANIYSGYRNPDIEKFAHMVIYFAERLAPFKTKLNKLLFYADFLMFRKSCFSISGLCYTAIDMGPVPNHFQSAFEYLAEEEMVDIIYVEFPKGTGEQFRPRREHPFDPTLFTKEELNVLETVASTFKKAGTNDIIRMSHAEEAWKQNEKNKGMISYVYAFDLVHI